jgi:hypothetical protein
MGLGVSRGRGRGSSSSEGSQGTGAPEKRAVGLTSIDDRIAELRTEVIGPYRRETELLGQERQHAAKIAAAEDALGVLKRALTLYEQGKNFLQIGRELGLDPRVVKGWLSQGKLPLEIACIKAERRKKVGKELRIPRAPSTSFAYLLGVFCGSVTPGQPVSQFRPRIRNRDVAQQLKAAFEQVVDGEARIAPRPYRNKQTERETYVVNCLSLPLTRHLNLVTDSNRRVPWEHLGTDEERRYFLKGLFDICSWVHVSQSNTPGCIGLQRKGDSYLIVELAHLLKKVGIVPRIALKPKQVLSIHEMADLQRFRDTIGFTDPEEQGRLQRLAGRSVKRRTYSEQDYVRAKKEWESDPSLNPGQIAARTGLSAEVIGSWRRDGMVPREVKRREYLEGLLNGHESNVDLLPVLFRKFNLSIDQCRAVAAQCSAEQVRKVAEEMQKEGQSPPENPEIFFARVTKAPPPQPAKNDRLSITREKLNSGTYAEWPYLQKVRDLAQQAPQLEFPLFLFEQFVGSLPKEERALARRLLVILANPDIAGRYHGFLTEEIRRRRRSSAAGNG